MRGLYTAIITPFKRDGSLDAEGLRENIAFQLESGVDGIVALGSTGEAATLTPEEKERVIVIAGEEIKGRVPLMVGTGCFSTAETVKRTKRAQALGADFALIITPYYNRPTQEGIFRHYSEVTKECDLPVMLYNNPGRTATALELATIERLAALPGIIGIKESSGSIEMVKEIVQALPGFIVMSGDDNLALESLKAGALGLISVLGNLMPKEVRALLEGQPVDLTPFINATRLESNPIPIKAMMEEAGMRAGPTRLPLCELHECNRQAIKQLFTEVSWDGSI